MSIATMSVYAVRAKGLQAPPAGTDNTESPVQGALGKITAFIPTEAIGAYVALLGIFKPSSTAGRWALLAVVAALALFLCYYQWSRRRAKAADAAHKLGVRALLLMSLFTLVALVAWVGSLPDSPFLSFGWYDVRIGGAAVVILGVVMPKAGELLGIAPSS